MSDFRYALRSIRRMPGLAAVVILSLAIGIGVNTVVFSWIQLLVFNPLPGVKGAGNFHSGWSGPNDNNVEMRHNIFFGWRFAAIKERGEMFLEFCRFCC